MKTWEEMNHKERAAFTVNDLMERKRIKEEELRKSIEKGEREAKAFVIECAYKTNRKIKN